LDALRGIHLLVEEHGHDGPTMEGHDKDVHGHKAETTQN